jgi:hypothetical protein
MADGRNFIEKTMVYTSKLKAPSNKKYYGRGKGDSGNGGFLDQEGIWNQFIDLDKNETGYKNEYFSSVKKGVWVEKCLSDDSEKLNEWLDNRGNDVNMVRLFVKNYHDENYLCLGIFKYSFTDKLKSSVIWNKI